MASDATTDDDQFKRFESCARHDVPQIVLLAMFYCNAREFRLEFERAVEAGECEYNFEVYFAAYKTRYNNTHNLKWTLSLLEFRKAGLSHYVRFMEDMRKERVTSSLSGAPRLSADVIDPACDGYEPTAARSTLAEYFGIKGYSNKAQIQTLFETYVHPPAARSPPLHTAAHRPERRSPACSRTTPTTRSCHTGGPLTPPHVHPRVH